MLPWSYVLCPLDPGATDGGFCLQISLQAGVPTEQRDGGFCNLLVVMAVLTSGVDCWAKA